MRVWTIHPRYLDDLALREAWRDGLNLRRAIAGGSVGRHAESAAVFLRARRPGVVVDAYLHAIHDEARRRGRSFDGNKLGPHSKDTRVTVCRQQVATDWADMCRLTAERNPDFHARLTGVQRPQCHPVFRRGSRSS